jgi:hypothetical protein
MAGRALRSILAATLGVACACARAPIPAPRRAVLPAHWRGAHSGAGAAAGTAAPSPWWRRLGDPELDRLITLALEHNADLEVAVARVRQARAAADAAAAERRPLLMAGAEVKGERLPETRYPDPDGVFVRPPTEEPVRLSAQARHEVDARPAVVVRPSAGSASEPTARRRNSPHERWSPTTARLARGAGRHSMSGVSADSPQRWRSSRPGCGGPGHAARRSPSAREPEALEPCGAAHARLPCCRARAGREWLPPWHHLKAQCRTRSRPTAGVRDRRRFDGRLRACSDRRDRAPRLQRYPQPCSQAPRASSAGVQPGGRAARSPGCQSPRRPH